MRTTSTTLWNGRGVSSHLESNAGSSGTLSPKHLIRLSYVKGVWMGRTWLMFLCRKGVHCDKGMVFKLFFSKLGTINNLWNEAPSKTKAPGGTPLYKLYRYAPPQTVWFLSRFGLKTGIDHYQKFRGVTPPGTKGTLRSKRLGFQRTHNDNCQTYTISQY